MTSVARRIWLGFQTILLVAACNAPVDRLPEYELSGQVMGTTYSIKLVAPGENVDKDEFAMALAERLESIDAKLSTYKETSELSLFNASDSIDWIKVSAELCLVVERALDVGIRTGGAFDVTVGPLVNLWGFGPGDDVTEPPPADLITMARRNVGLDKLQADCDVPALRKTAAEVYVDLSGFAKGYAVDQVAGLSAAHELTDFLVEIGGELRMRGHNSKGAPWSIAVEEPNPGSRKVESVVQLTDAAMATSGDYRNFFTFGGKQYSHTIDPATGWPVEHSAASVTVVAETAAEADALATALLVLGPEEGLEYATSEGIAAYFLLRTDAGIEQRLTREFVALMNW